MQYITQGNRNSLVATAMKERNEQTVILKVQEKMENDKGTDVRFEK